MLFPVSMLYSQGHVSGFNMVSLNYKVNPKWLAYVEFQTRSRRDYSVLDYYEVKGGLGYNFDKQNQIFFGTGRYATYEKMAISQEELRIWLQYIYSHRLGNVKIDHRLRTEQRYFLASQSGEKSQAVRFRYRLGTTVPLNNDKIEAKTLFANAFEEVFFSTGAPAFKRNRSFAGLGYQFNSLLSSTIGYMFQREFSARKNDNYHFVYFALNFTIDSFDTERDPNMPLGD